MTELDNKIRLDEARRRAVRERMRKADKSRNKKKLYGGEKEEKEAKKIKNDFRNLKNPYSVARKAKGMATAPTKFRGSDVPIYGTAMILAGLKDLLDLSFVGSLPVIGTVITFCVSIAIAFILMFDSNYGLQRKVARRLTKRFLVLIAGTMIEGFLFGLNFFPFEMFTVFIIYWMALADRKKG